MVDYEMSLRHNLPLIPVINEYAKMTVAGELQGKKVLEARQIIVDTLRAAGLLEKEEEISQNLSKAQRTGGTIEPLPKLQWFIDVNKKFKAKTSKLAGIQEGQEVTLKEVMTKVVENKQISILPERFEKIYYHWIGNLRDWCISRQIIYGHQIPVWYRSSPSSSEGRDGERLQEIYCGINAPKDESWIQDTDTLDTWFSSALWTFSTLGWPNDTQDMKIYHPTSAMMPGYEILFFWVARMVLMSGFLLGDIPFKHVYLHGIVRDKQGRKFSKSLNNGIDPLEMMGKYGTDALRMSLVFGAAPGNDVMFDEQKVKGMKHFANKLWNISRFVLANLESPQSLVLSTKDLPASTDADKDILAKLEALIKSSTEHMENFRLHEAAQDIYQFTWHEFADIYIEASKAQLSNPELKENTLNILLYNLITVLKLLHPFMPFITEELWGKMREAGIIHTDKNLLMVSQWPG
jgi:valyl-tRNA synthetase